MSRKYDLTIANAVDYLRERREQGGTVPMIVAALGHSDRSHVGKSMKVGRELGKFVGLRSTFHNRMTYYLPEFKPSAQTGPKLQDRTPPKPKQVGSMTRRAAELARRPGGAGAADLAADLGIKSGSAAERFQRAHKQLGIFRADRGAGNSVRCRYFGTYAEAAAWGTVHELGMKAARKMPKMCAPKKVKAMWQPGQEVVHSGEVTICPSGEDRRFTFTPPPGYVSALDPNDCRPWARAATA